MMMNRAQRRAIKGNAPCIAAKLAGRCYDIHGGQLVPIRDAQAIKALTRAFALLLRSGSQPLAVPISESEAKGFPRYDAAMIQGGVSWLAVGLDAENRASYTLQSAKGADRTTAHETARMLALSRLDMVCATAGFPMGDAKGRALCERKELARYARAREGHWQGFAQARETLCEN